MRRWTPWFIAALLVGAVLPRAAAAQSLLFDYVGFDYESPNPNPGTFGEPGSSYHALGYVPGLFAPLVSDSANNQYTFITSGLTPASIVPVGGFLIIDYTAGGLQIYEDAKPGYTFADFAPNPPNADVPSKFTDGTLYLDCQLTNFQLVVNTATGTGSFEGVLNVVGGSQLGNFPLNQRKGFTFSGVTGNALNIPPGYSHQVDGQAFLDAPVAAKHVTWGRLKSDFR